MCSIELLFPILHSPVIHILAMASWLSEHTSLPLSLGLSHAMCFSQWDSDRHGAEVGTVLASLCWPSCPPSFTVNVSDCYGCRLNTQPGAKPSRAQPGSRPAEPQPIHRWVRERNTCLYKLLQFQVCLLCNIIAITAYR